MLPRKYHCPKRRTAISLEIGGRELRGSRLHKSIGIGWNAMTSRTQFAIGCLCLLALDQHCGSVALAQETSAAAGSDGSAGWASRKLSEKVLAKRGSDPSFSIDFARYQRELNDLPIGVFDSGVGGLTVLETLLGFDQHDNSNAQPGSDGIPDFQNEKFVYLGDQANMPYGNYSSVGKEDFLRELIMKDAIFLLGNRYWKSPSAATPSFDKPPVKAIVIACNTATAYGLADIRAALELWALPVLVVGVVEAGADSFVQELPAFGAPAAVAVMATAGTCSSGAYPKAIRKAAGLAGKRLPTVWQQGSIGLAGAIEGNSSFVRVGAKDAEAGEQPSDYQGPSIDNAKAPIDISLSSAYGFELAGLAGTEENAITWRLNSVENYVRYEVTTMMEGYRKSGATEPIGKVILGCTHFPFESKRILENLSRLRDYRDTEGQQPYRELISDQVELIDPGQLTAKQLYRQLLRTRQLIRGNAKAEPKVMQIYLSVPGPAVQSMDRTLDGGFTSEFKYGRTAGESEVDETRIIPLTRKLLPSSLIELLSKKCPNVWGSIDD